MVTLGDGRVAGFEMLARWDRPTLGNIPPNVFIPLAESLGLIGALSKRLIRKACAMALAWPEDLFVGVNVSSLQLRDRTFPALVKSILDETGLSPIRLYQRPKMMTRRASTTRCWCDSIGGG